MQCVWGINGEDRIISKGLLACLDPQILAPVFICGENTKVLCMPTIHMTCRPYKTEYL
jgi:hypothetical protein